MASLPTPSYAEASTSATHPPAPSPSPPKYKVIFFTNAGCLHKLKPSLFATGAGTDSSNVNDKPLSSQAEASQHCVHYTEAVAHYHHGDRVKTYASGKLDKAKEVRLLKCEVLCVGEVVRAAVEALKRVHYFGQGAVYEVYRMEEF